MPIWKPIDGFSAFEVSDEGEVRRIIAAKRGKGCGTPLPYLLRPYEGNRGYWYYVLNQGTKRTSVAAHTLVCAAFHGPKPSHSHQVAHYDGSKKNNSPTNLRWTLPQGNQDDKERHGRVPRGEKQGNAKIKVPSVKFIRKAYATGAFKEQELADAFGMTQAAISLIILKKNWRHI